MSQGLRVAHTTSSPGPGSVFDVICSCYCTQEWRSTVCVFLNGKKYELEDVQPETTLLEFIRATGLTGSKLGCGEVRTRFRRMARIQKPHTVGGAGWGWEGPSVPGLCTSRCGRLGCATGPPFLSTLQRVGPPGDVDLSPPRPRVATGPPHPTRPLAAVTSCGVVGR